jgi:enterochelin esterase family protein
MTASWRTVVPGERIDALAAAVTASPETFWARLERTGTPLVTELSDDAVDVTFILRAQPTSGPWTLTDGISPGANPLFALTNVAGTDLWHVTLRLPRDARVTYTFTRDVRVGAGRPDFDLAAHLAARVVDPFNPRTVSYPDQGFLSPWGRTVSLLALSEQDSPIVPDERGRLSTHTLTSSALGRDVPVHVYSAPGLPPSPPLAILFDGWELVEIGRIGAVFDAAVQTGALPPFVAVMPDPGEHRTQDLLFSDDHTTFVAEELLGWARATFGTGRTVIGGASLGGLAALYSAVSSPGVFTGAVSLIGAVGAHRDGEPDWLTRRFTQSPPRALRLYLSAGLLDDDTFPSGLPAILSANRRLREALTSHGYDVAYREFPGGHDWVWLPEEFARGLAYVLSGPAVPQCGHPSRTASAGTKIGQ